LPRQGEGRGRGLRRGMGNGTVSSTRGILDHSTQGSTSRRQSGQEPIGDVLSKNNVSVLRLRRLYDLYDRGYTLGILLDVFF